MSAGLTSARDLSMRNSFPGAGLAITLQFYCGHKGSQAGAKFKVMPKPLGRIPLKCGACHAAWKAEQAAKAGIATADFSGYTVDSQHL